MNRQMEYRLNKQFCAACGDDCWRVRGLYERMKYSPYRVLCNQCCREGFHLDTEGNLWGIANAKKRDQLFRLRLMAFRRRQWGRWDRVFNSWERANYKPVPLRCVTRPPDPTGRRAGNRLWSNL